ncbi:MAG: glutathione S-transferase family protein [Betaproteobacteria bacterium]|nr:glutathione S-transferase family protein [Betaproteobacteria bacterium]
MKLYGCKGCGSTVVEAMLQMAGLEYEYVEAVTWEPFSHHPDLGKVNPLKQVPTLVLDDGNVMTESAAILLWLCERLPHLVPQDAAARAQFYRWMVFVPANMYALAPFRDFPAKWVEGEDAQKAFREKTSVSLKAFWQQIETELQPSPYLLGKEMSALDMYLAMIARWWVGRKWVKENCPKIDAAIILTEQHPVVAKVWEKNFAK